MDFNGQTIWIADAHRSDGTRFVVRADDKLSAFWNWNLRFVDPMVVYQVAPYIKIRQRLTRQDAHCFCTNYVHQTDLNQAEDIFFLGSSPPPDLQSQNQHSGGTGKKEPWYQYRLLTIR
jgi:hypothetical protein